MAVTPSEEALAQKVVDLSKRTAHVDTGALKRSIYYTVARGSIVFRQLFYGQYNDNSELIENAKRMMKGISYSIEELDEEGNIVKEQREYGSGRKITSVKRPSSKTTSAAQALINKILTRRAKENKQKDNRG